jgi:hypothetical protein
LRDRLSEQVWKEHEAWLERHARYLIARERWQDRDWQAAQLLADAAWNGDNLYLYAALKGVQEHHYRRVERWHAEQARERAAFLEGFERTL